ncbi:conserved hypothetical protein [Ricinus communis]|uniref:Serine-threonine/tyrosine-protein kinase catalytic domain-containing protein n=1 Tax=Ricinus communis TaxID=3988 RepID=B9S2G9_RICCO|nr:conserved hypothetical protein [Ricinus communis]
MATTYPPSSPPLHHHKPIYHNKRIMKKILPLLFFLLSTFALESFCIEDDLTCLEGLRNSFTNPLNRLASWDLTNNSITFVCKLNSVSYWNEKENCIISLQLTLSKLSDQLPDSLKYCCSLQTLDLPNNALYGSIPPQVCGRPLGQCGGLSSKSLDIIIIVSVLGATGSLILVSEIWWLLFVRLIYLMDLAIKRLSACKLSEKQFRSEMNKLAQLRHPNLVPLLEFYVIEEERLLAYKHMPNGTLHSELHGCGFGISPSDVLDCPTRVRIGVGAARGLAWLHHGDFGLARLVGSRDSNDNSFVNGDLGEFSYVAPEYSSITVASLKVSTSQSKDAVDKAVCGKGHNDEIIQSLKVAWSYMVSRPKDRPSMSQVCNSVKGMAEKHGFSEQYDEFLMIFGKQDPKYKE